MVAAGRLRNYVQLQSRTASVGSHGQVDQTWTTYAWVWADFVALRGAELVAASQLNATVTTKAVIRWRDDVKAEHRIVFGSRTLEIISTLDPDGRSRTLELMIAESIE